MDSKHGEIRTGPQASLQLCRLPIRFDRGQIKTHPGTVANTDNQNQRITNRTDLHGSCLYKQRRGDEVWPLVCLTMENPDLVHQQAGYSHSPTHSRPAECCCKQAIQTRSDISNNVVSHSRYFPSNMPQVAQTSNRPLHDEVQHQAAQVCVPSTGPPGLGSGCTQPILGRSGPVCLPTSSNFGQSGGEVAGLPIQKNHCDCSRVSQHALVLGSSSYVQPNSTEPALPPLTSG